MLRTCWLLLLLIALSGAVLLAQDASSPQLQNRSAEPPNASGRQITLDVQVTDRSGTPIRGLQAQDFTLLDDKAPQKIVSFSEVGATPASDPPVELVLVTDAVNASYQTITFERGEVEKFLLQNGGQLPRPLSIAVFSDKGTSMQNASSRDGKMLAAMYDQYQVGLRTITRSAGFYGAAERLDLSLKSLMLLSSFEAKKPGRKLMIWVSPGWPMLSGPGIDLQRKAQQQFFNSVVDASTALREADVTVYAIDPLALADAGGLRVSYYKEFVQGVKSASHVQPGNLALQVIAEQTGGLALHSTNDLESALATCAADANHYYVLSFNTRPADQPNEYHSLAVSVDKPRVTARTRTGYYAQR